jgi:hypothetical protein
MHSRWLHQSWSIGISWRQFSCLISSRSCCADERTGGQTRKLFRCIETLDAPRTKSFLEMAPKAFGVLIGCCVRGILSMRNGSMSKRIQFVQDLSKGGRTGRIDMNLTKEQASGALALQSVVNRERI